MSTKFQPIEIPPGVVSTPTKNVRSSNWAEVNLVRWTEGELQPVGPQVKLAYNLTFASRCRRIHGWYDLNQTYRIAYVCEQHVYVDNGGVLTEITPTGGWPAPGVPSQGGYGDLNYGEDLPAGAPTTSYGSPRLYGAINPIDVMPPVWSVDNMGAILLCMSSLDGRLMEWDPANPATPNLLTETTASPDTGTGTGKAPHGRCFVVTQERFVVIFGMYADGTPAGSQPNPRRFGWCDQENRNAWNFSSVTSQAGFLDIEPAAPIICAEGGKFGVLFFTAKKAYLSKYLGLPYVYDYVELADNCTPWSPASITSTSSYLAWMSQQGMFTFDGSSIAPVACPIRSWITDDYDPVNVRLQAVLIHFARHNELWWFYPQLQQNSNTPYNTRVAIFGYREGWWSQGRMSRSAGITASYTAEAILADGTAVFKHEQPTAGTSGGAYINADPPWAETFDLNLTSGSRLATLKQVIPDLGGPGAAQLQFSFWSSKSRSVGGPAGAWTPPVGVTQRGDGYVDARVTGRDIRMRISLAGPIQMFTLGQHLVDYAIRGDR